MKKIEQRRLSLVSDLVPLITTFARVVGTIAQQARRGDVEGALRRVEFFQAVTTSELEDDLAMVVELMRAMRERDDVVAADSGR